MDGDPRRPSVLSGRWAFASLRDRGPAERGGEPAVRGVAVRVILVADRADASSIKPTLPLQLPEPGPQALDLADEPRHGVTAEVDQHAGPGEGVRLRLQPGRLRLDLGEPVGLPGSLERGLLVRLPVPF